MKHKRGQLIVYSGPSGVGKGTLLSPLLAPKGPLMLSVSATTRQPRPGEIDGVHYHFVNSQQFLKMVANGEMLEYAQYNSHYYGTPSCFVEQQLEAGRNVILEIETKGASQVHALCPDALMIFVMPPSLEELADRLEGRGTETDAERAGRLAAAAEEIRLADQYDFIVINDDIESAREQLLCAINAGGLITRLNRKRIEEVLKNAETSNERNS
ncbi:guanylate kinase [Oscillospiraceae bacterium LTW-04]|nr:guanylate kinase [Oscillospiraceae bacterium MB24-C1]